MARMSRKNRQAIQEHVDRARPLLQRLLPLLLQRAAAEVTLRSARENGEKAMMMLPANATSTHVAGVLALWAKHAVTTEASCDSWWAKRRDELLQVADETDKAMVALARHLLPTGWSVDPAIRLGHPLHNSVQLRAMEPDEAKVLARECVLAAVWLHEVEARADLASGNGRGNLFPWDPGNLTDAQLRILRAIPASTKSPATSQEVIVAKLAKHGVPVDKGTMSRAVKRFRGMNPPLILDDQIKRTPVGDARAATTDAE